MLHLVINPTAGNGLAARVGDDMEAMLGRYGTAYVAHRTQYAGHAETLARDAAAAGATTVVAVGGDGTVLETMRGIHGSGAALGIIPAGTGNDVVKMINTPRKPEEALDFILNHPAGPLDAGRINDSLFLNVCGTGIDVVVLDYTLAAKRFVRGILPYLWGVLRAVFTYRPIRVRVAVDGAAPAEHDIMLIAVGNGRFIGGGMDVAPEARPDDGLFDLLIMAGMPRWKVPFHLPKLLNGKIRKAPGVHYQKCRHVVIEGEGMRVNIDGEVIPMPRADLQIIPDALRVHW